MKFSLFGIRAAISIGLLFSTTAFAQSSFGFREEGKNFRLDWDGAAQTPVGDFTLSLKIEETDDFWLGDCTIYSSESFQHFANIQVDARSQKIDGLIGFNKPLPDFLDSFPAVCKIWVGTKVSSVYGGDSSFWDSLVVEEPYCVGFSISIPISGNKQSPPSDPYDFVLEGD